MTAAVTVNSDTTVTVTTGDTTGSITCWSSGLTVYVDQPNRPRVTDSARFAALERDWSGKPRRYDTKVTDAAYTAARQILEAFDAHPGTPAFIDNARRTHADNSLEASDRMADWAASQIADLTDLLEAIRDHRTRVTDAVADPTRPVPTIDELLTHPARYTARHTGH